MIRPAIALAWPLVALLGCQVGTPPPAQNYTPAPAPVASAPETQAQWCRRAAELLANPYGDAFTKQAILETMRNRGCLK